MAEEQKSNKNLLMGLGLVSLMVVLGFFFIFRIADNQRDQDLNAWKDRLNIVADSRASAVSAWLNRHLKSIEDLAMDATIQFYVTDLIYNGENNDQRGYVFSLLSAEAERQGFHERRPLDTVAANVNRPRQAGIAIVANNGRALVASTGMPAIEPSSWAGKKRSFINLTFIDKIPFLVFGTPIKAADGMDMQDQLVWLMGAKSLNEELFSVLEQPGAMSKTGETYLVTAGDSDGLIRTLSPLAGGGRIGSNRHDGAASFVLSQPGAYTMTTNYQDELVLVTGRELTAPVPWSLVRSVTSAEALSVINDRRNSLIISLSLAILITLALMILVWRHGINRRLESAYSEQSALSNQNEALSEFLQSVSDSQPTAIAAIDKDFRIRFANQEMGKLSDVPAADLMNRRFETAFNAEDAKIVKAAVKNALGGRKTQVVLDLKVKDSLHYMKFQGIPLGYEKTSDQGQALIVLQDITDLVSARETAEANLKQLVGTLTQIIDARDPWSTFHSQRVSDVSAAIAEEMECSLRDIETVKTAGQLMNLGKIFVPSEILTKTTPLDDAELELVHGSMKKGAALLEGVVFGGPVAETLMQVTEHWDGNGGPEGLSGQDILQEARILAVANAFVGMVSSRAHRSGFDFDKASKFLNEDVGTKFDRRVVTALLSVIEIKGGRETWAHYGEAVEEK